MIQLPNDFKEFLRLCRSKGVEYLVVGGYAVGHYGYPRATGDLDVWIALHPDNAKAVVEALKTFGFNLPDISPALFLKPGQIVRMGNPPLRLEIITGIDGVEFADCYHKRQVVEIDGVSVYFISLEDLKTNKKASGRNKDLDDLEHL